MISIPCPDFCYGTASFENVNIAKIDPYTPNPQFGIFIENSDFCSNETCLIDQAELTVRNGEITGMTTGIFVQGKVELELENVQMHGIGDEDTKTFAIEAQAGRSMNQRDLDLYSECQYRSNPNITIRDSQLYNNGQGQGILIKASHARLTLDNTKIYDNYLETLFDTDCSLFSVTNTNIHDNYANWIFIPSVQTELFIAFSSIKDNISDKRGFVFFEGDMIEITNSEVLDNVTSWGGRNGAAVTDGGIMSTNTCWQSNDRPYRYTYPRRYATHDVYHSYDPKGFDIGRGYDFVCENFRCDEYRCFEIDPRNTTRTFR